MRAAIFIDFDGTITTRDSLDALVDAFVGPEDRQAFDRMFLAGDRPLWELLDLSLKACGVPLDEAIAYLHANVPIDPAFAAFHAWSRERGIPCEIVSAGVHEIVSSYLAASGLAIPIRANRAAPGVGCFGLTPETPHCPTGVDKGAVVRAARESGQYAIFIGDGFSDRLAVPEADLVYAKAGLARYCSHQGVPHVGFRGFGEIQADLERRLDGPGKPHAP